MVVAVPAWARSASRRISPVTCRVIRSVERRAGCRFGSAIRLALNPSDLLELLLMMGGEGLTQATKVAILNANYVAARLEGGL
jgi:glycine cleavage system protein P-like pyridoxal-binding family